MPASTGTAGRRGRIIVAAALALTVCLRAAPAAGQLGAIRDAARKVADEKRKADEAKRAADEAKKKAEADPGAATPAGQPKEADAKPVASDPSSAEPTFQAYSKFDFVPGEKIIGLDDFMQDAVGDFPGKWDTNASGEIVTIAGKPGRWLKITRNGFFRPEFITELPENFTVEFDLTVAPTFNSGQPLYFALAQLENAKQAVNWQGATNLVTFSANPGAVEGRSLMNTRQDGDGTPANHADTPQLSAKAGKPVRVSIWRQRQRVRLYMNEEKVWDVPRAIASTAKFNSLVFAVHGVDSAMEYYIANVRVSTGAPDTRNKLLTEGRWVTHGILFDVNSDRIKAESYGSLKEISGVLSENADLKIQIVGHTDSDGDEASNLDLSKRRAAAVKAALTSQFGIDAGRMDTDGRGESQPVDKNDNPVGKANNRRVEFVRK